MFEAGHQLEFATPPDALSAERRLDELEERLKQASVCTMVEAAVAPQKRAEGSKP